jgi:hypothetical protein
LGYRRFEASACVRIPRAAAKGDANVYKQIALALKPGEWRNAGLVTVLAKMRTFNGTRTVIHVDPYDDATAEGERAGPHRLIDVTDSPPREWEDNSVTRPQSHHNDPGHSGAPTKLRSPQRQQPCRCQSRMTASLGVPSRFPGLQPLGQGDGPRTYKTRCVCLAPPGAANTPPSRRDSGRSSQVRNPSSRASDDRSSRASVVGRARADSLAEDPSACWVPVRPSSSAPGGSEPGGAPAGLCLRLKGVS